MEIIKDKISKTILKKNYSHYFNTVIKAVVDIEREIIAVDAELHSDLEELLLKDGSKQKNLWGINLYPDKDKENFIEYSALINIRPGQNNNSMQILNSEIREKIKKIIDNLIEYGT